MTRRTIETVFLNETSLTNILLVLISQNAECNEFIKKAANYSLSTGEYINE